MRAVRIVMPMAIAGILMLCASAPAQDDSAKMVDNPQFHAWEQYAVGSSETLAGEIQTGQPQMPTIPMAMTHKLVEKTADHLTIEATNTMTVMGQQHTTPAQKINVPTKIKDQNIKALGTEKVDAAGKSFECKVFEMEGPAAPAPPGPHAAAQKASKAKVWVSDDVPGGMVKMEVTSPHGNLTLTLKSFEKK